MITKQSVNIKKVQVDSEKKVTIVLEFIAADRDSRDNVFTMIEMQGEVIEASFICAQMPLPIPVGANN